MALPRLAPFAAPVAAGLTGCPSVSRWLADKVRPM